jgi:hypothetical protein
MTMTWRRFDRPVDRDHVETVSNENLARGYTYLTLKRPDPSGSPSPPRHPAARIKRAYKLRQQPVAAPNIRASWFFFVTVNTLF